MQKLKVITIDDYANKSIEERRSEFIKKEKDFLKLERTLFSKSGNKLIYTPEEEIFVVKELARRGKFIKTNNVDFGFGKENKTLNHCHDISSMLWKEGIGKWCIGYALCDDDLWRKHSWVKVNSGKLKNKFMEVTPIKRVLYFGIELTDEESKLLD